MVRKATLEDLDSMMFVYAKAKDIMDQSGNPNQWKKGHPSREMILEDIRKEQSFVVERNGQIHGAFAFILGIDPTYLEIEDGAWLNEEPYGTIHRLASDGAEKGIFTECIDYGKTQIKNLRIDTHENNRIMQHLIEKHGFVRCGMIHLANGAPRIAYQFCDTNE